MGTKTICNYVLLPTTNCGVVEYYNNYSLATRRPNNAVEVDLIFRACENWAVCYGSPLVPWEITFFAPYRFTLYGVRQIIIWRTPNNYMADAK